jgi:tRNA dimethylallyltransferase
MKIRPKIIVILGQTSTGKSDFAVEIAKQVKGEIISADSRQVYKGMNLGTGKITKKEMKNIQHHLLDVVSPSKIYSVSDFQKKAFKKIEEIIKKEKIPIICGGTGFYINSIVDGIIFPKVPPNKLLREKLSNKSAPELFEILKKLDKERSLNIDANNGVRLIRAIEIAKALGKVPKLKTADMETDSAMAESVSMSKFNVLKIGLTLPPDILKEMIKVRLLKRINKGMVIEIKNLHKNGLSWKRMESLGLEYRFGAQYLQNKITKKEMVEQINKETWAYAKRQKTWFKRDKNIVWINPLKIHEKALVIKKVKDFLK